MLCGSYITEESRPLPCSDSSTYGTCNNLDYEDMLEIIKKQNSILKEIKQSVDNLGSNIMRTTNKENEDI